LLAITDWGNNISSQARLLTQYNTQRASLERDTGTILETHGIFFYEERYGSVGPLGRLHQDQCYPRDVHPGENSARHPGGDQPGEQFFELEDPMQQLRRRSQPIPPPRSSPPSPEPIPAPNALVPPGSIRER
jgi:hypothetical protein